VLALQNYHKLKSATIEKCFGAFSRQKKAPHPKVRGLTSAGVDFKPSAVFIGVCLVVGFKGHSVTCPPTTVHQITGYMNLCGQPFFIPITAKVEADISSTLEEVFLTGCFDPLGVMLSNEWL